MLSINIPEVSDMYRIAERMCMSTLIYMVILEDAYIGSTVHSACLSAYMNYRVENIIFSNYRLDTPSFPAPVDRKAKEGGRIV